MYNNLVKINLFGDLGENVGKSWDLCVKSASEAIRAINTLTNNRFSNYFINNNKLQSKYRIIINGQDFISPVDEINEENYEMAFNSELVIEKDNLETIDIVPFIENNDAKTTGLILGIVLIIVGVILIATLGWTGVGGAAGVALIIAGIGIGVMALLSRPPKYGDFREAEQAGKESYLFGGPINIIGEGGPVPVGYGRVLVGSQVISSAYKIEDYEPTE